MQIPAKWLWRLALTAAVASIAVSCMSTQTQNTLTPVLLGPQTRLRSANTKTNRQIALESLEEENSFFVYMYFAGSTTDVSKFETILIESAEEKKASKPSFRVDNFAVSSGGYMDVFVDGYYVKVTTSYSTEQGE